MRRVVEVESRPVTVSPDDPIDDRDRWQALVHGRAIDELTGLPVEVTCSSVTKRSVCTTGAGGLFGLTGRQRDVPVGSPWTIRVAATGFASVTLEGLFTGTMLPLGDVELRRAPVVLFGSTVARPKNDALGSVTITVSAIKRTEAVAQSAADIVAIDLPLAMSRTLPTTVHSVTLADRVLLPSEAPLRLTAVAERGATEIHVADTGPITVGQVLRLGDLDREFVTVARIDPLQPRLELATPLAVRRSRATVVAEQTVAMGAPTPLLAPAQAGDSVLFVAQAAIASRQTVRIRTAAGVDEFRFATPFTATTAADGIWSFPPISRVTEVALTVTHPARALFPPVATDPIVHINRGAAEQRRDFILN